MVYRWTCRNFQRESEILSRCKDVDDSCTSYEEKAAKLSLAHLGVDFLQKLADKDELEPRIDDQNVLHIRLSLSALAKSSIEFSEGLEEQVKGRIKLEVYPGQDPVKNAQELLNNTMEFARNQGLPINPKIG